MLQLLLLLLLDVTCASAPPHLEEQLETLVACRQECIDADTVCLVPVNSCSLW
jgi:hypothetical protein